MSNGWGNSGWGSNEWGEEIGVMFVKSASFTHGSPSLSGVGAGNLILGVVLWAGNPGNTPVDNHRDTWIAATRPFAAQPFGMQVLNPYLQLFYALNVPGGQLDVAFASNNTVMASALLEYSGVTSFVKATGNAGFGGQSPFMSPNINTAPGDTVVSVGYCNGTLLVPGGPFPPAPRVVMMEPQPNLTVADAVSIGGLYQAVFTARNVDAYAVLLASFR